MDEGYSSYLLYLLWLFTAGLSPSLPPSFHLSDRQLLADSLCCCSLRPESPRFNPPLLHLLPNMLLYFTSLLSPRPRHQPGRTCSSLQFTRAVRKLKGPPCGLHENISDISVQSEFVWSVGDVFVFELPQIRTV